MLLLMKGLGVQSRFAPLPKNFHLLLCAIITILFIFLYIRQKKIKDIYWLIACDTTAILQFFGDKYTAFVIGVFEVVLMCLIFSEYLKELKEKRAAKAAAAKESSEGDDDLGDIEKAVKLERKKLVSDDPNDVISKAFDSEDTEK